MRCEALLAAVKAAFSGACGVFASKPLLEGAPLPLSVSLFAGGLRYRCVGELGKKFVKRCAYARPARVSTAAYGTRASLDL
jgi:hypothetical protein